jgi:hypothetical protein
MHPEYKWTDLDCFFLGFGGFCGTFDFLARIGAAFFLSGAMSRPPRRGYASAKENNGRENARWSRKVEGGWQVSYGGGGAWGVLCAYGFYFEQKHA